DLVASSFSKRIRNYGMLDGLKLPTNLRAYDGISDPDDHLMGFMTIDVHKLSEPAWCHFHITLCGAARFWISGRERSLGVALKDKGCITWMRLGHPSTGYLHALFPKLFPSNCIIHQTTCPHTPEQNGVAERKNRVLLEITRALLIESQAPKFVSPEALATAAYLINRLPTQILNSKTPWQILTEYTKPLSVLTLEPQIFGCTVFVYIPISYRSNGPAEKCVFVGYRITQKGYRCYNPKTQHMFTTMNCVFLETKYYYASQHSGQGERECITTLSWLRYVTCEEGMNHSTQPEDPNISVVQEAPNLIHEVCNTHSSPISQPVETTNNTSGQGESVQEQEIFATQEDTPVEKNEHIEEQENFPT
nr:putative RNA-directed DNA polymerase [Tanacetum cinerariifolium]